MESVGRALELLQQDDPQLRMEAARDIRRLTKNSHRCRRQLRQAVAPLVSMLRLHSPESHETALLALLNLAVKDQKYIHIYIHTCLLTLSLSLSLSLPPLTQSLLLLLLFLFPHKSYLQHNYSIHVAYIFSNRLYLNKIKIVEAGALEPIVSFLQSKNQNLQEYATASLLTLSASSTNKPIISACGAIPLIVDVLRDGSPQAKADAVMALSNLSTHPDNLSIILESNPIPFTLNLLKTCKKSSKTAEKCSALIESLVGYDEGRAALTSVDGGVLAVVEVLENGTLQSREHAVGTLLTMCQSDRCKYREPILREGVIPGLLELTVQGTPKSQPKARTLLQLLRESPYPRSDIEADTLENIVCNIISQIDGDSQCGKAKKMLAEMVQVSMEQSLRHLQQRALVFTPSNDLAVNTCASQVSSE